MDDKKLLLIDAYALIYRAYYALIRAPRFTSKGLNTSAIFGFCNTLEDVLRKEKPTHVAVCFDPKGGTFRHDAYPEYKAQRDAQPEDITLSIPYIKDILAALNITVIEVPGFEADDVIGTLSRKAEAEGYLTLMMTPDKDYGQLVTDRVLMYRPALKGTGFEVRGVKEVCEKYGISSTSQVIDLLALEGDASDNIPGCPGVGEKTAVKLINEWGSVENLIENVDSLKGAIQKKVAENVEQIKFSKFLVTIKTDVPVDVKIEDLACKDADESRLAEIYTELEFKSFLTKMGVAPTVEVVSSPVASPQASLFDEPSLFDEVPVAQECVSVSAQYRTASTLKEVSEVVSQALGMPRVGVAIYASGAEAMTARWKGIAISMQANEAVYVALPNEKEAREQMKVVLRMLLCSKHVQYVSHDVKRDYIILHNEGIELTHNYYDTAVAHYLLQSEMKHSLPSLAFTYLGCMASQAVEDALQRKIGSEIDETMVGNVMCEIADLTLRLCEKFHPMLEAEGLISLLEEIELPFVKVLADMEIVGVKIDVSELAKMSQSLTSRMQEIEKSVYELAGGEFNVASPMQVGEVLFERLKIDPKAKRTKGGAYSTAEDVLEKYRKVHPIVDKILQIRGLKKLLSTYINALPELINPATGKIHTSYNQTVTATGRISSANPNLQNIPVRTDDGREIRRAFIADEGCVLYAADYSQIELRLIADMSGDENMIEAFRSGADIHSATAAKVYGVSLDDVTDEQRRYAKTANFGIIYGISAFGLSERLSISRADAKMLIDGYYASYPQMRQYMDDNLEQVRKDGFVSTIKGRRRYLPDINSRNAVVRGYAERNAVNAPIQGSAADIIKVAMIDIARDFANEGLRSKMIMQVHDELVFNVVPEELSRVEELVKKNMENAYHGRVALTVSAGVGNNWLEAH
ncbi:MAG: DNA polymerase I [Muribaculaceae bacterium]|nr:DNA polymerase I [Muribaculaceae bacterium]